MKKALSTLLSTICLMTALAFAPSSALHGQDTVRICIEWDGGGRYLFRSENIENLRGFQFPIEWDTTYSKFQSFEVIQFNEFQQLEAFSLLASPGDFRHLWTTLNNPLTVPDGEVLAVLDLETTNPVLGAPRINEESLFTVEFIINSMTRLPFELSANCNPEMQLITGTVAADENQNCLVEANEQGLAGYTVSFFNDEEEFLTVTNELGEYFIWLESAIYQATVFNQGSIESNCPTTMQINAVGSGDTFNLDWSIQGIDEDCDLLSVNIGTPEWNPCDTATLSLRVQNLTPVEKPDNDVIIVLPEGVTWVDSELPATMLTSNIYRLDVEVLAPSEIERSTFRVFYNCDLDPAVAPCILVDPTEVDLCFDDSMWSGARLRTSATCDNGEVILTVTNVENSDMQDPVDITIFRNDQIHMVDQVTLPGQESMEYNFQADEATYRIVADQVASYLLPSYPTSSIEGCGTNPSYGFVRQYAENDEFEIRDFHCLQANQISTEGHFTAHPEGLQEPNYVLRERSLEYRFAYRLPTGDTLRRLALEIELDENLDPLSIHSVHSNLPITWELQGQDILRLLIEGVEISSDQEDADLFVQYSIRPRASTPDGTEILQSATALINTQDTIVTPRLLRTVVGELEDFIVSAEGNILADSRLQVSPNPVTGDRIFVQTDDREWSHGDWFSSEGRLISRFDRVDVVQGIPTAHLSSGLYLLRLYDVRGHSAVAKVIIP